MITEILSFLQIFSVRKTTTQVFYYFRKHIYISSIFWAFKSNLQIIMWLCTLYCFFLTLITVFSYVWCHTSLSVSTIFSFCVFFHLLFHSLLATRRILQFTTFGLISLQPARSITEIRNTS